MVNTSTRNTDVAASSHLLSLPALALASSQATLRNLEIQTAHHVHKRLVGQASSSCSNTSRVRPRECISQHLDPLAKMWKRRRWATATGTYHERLAFHGGSLGS